MEVEESENHLQDQDLEEILNIEVADSDKTTHNRGLDQEEELQIYDWTTETTKVDALRHILL